MPRAGLRTDGLHPGSGVVAAGGGGALVAIETISGALAAYDFTGIATDYTSLMISFSGRSDVVADVEGLLVQLNGDTVVTNYTTHGMSDGSEINVNDNALASIPGANAGVNRGGFLEIWIHDYQSSFQKVIHAMGSEWRSGVGFRQVLNMATRWDGVAVVNRIRLLPLTGSFTAQGKATLFGVG